MTEPRRSSGPRGLSATLSKAADKVFRRRGFAQGRILTEWPQVVGETLAAQSCPEKLSFASDPGAGGTLHVRVSPGVALELQHLEPLVVERINTYFGFRAVARIAMVQGPLPRPEARRLRRKPLAPEREAAIVETVADTGDGELRTALADLGRAVATREGEG